MNKEDSKNLLIVILLVLFAIVVIFAFGLNFDNQKYSCLQSGGKWVQGVIDGTYSYFCIPSGV